MKLLCSLFNLNTQIHLYTLERGRISFSSGERAFIFEDTNIDPDSERIFGTFQRREVGQNVFVTYLTALHILLQVAVGLTIMKLIPTYYKSISGGKGGKQVKNNTSVSIFWSNIFFAAIIDVLFVGLDLYLIVSVYTGVDDALRAIVSTGDRSALQTVFAFGMLGILVSFTLIFLEFLVAVGIPKNTELYIPGLLKLFCCFFSCRTKKMDGIFWRKVLQTFAIWLLMVFLQLVAGSVIPYLVLAIVNPVPSVTFLALGASTLFCLIVFVANVIQVSVQLKNSSCYEKVVLLVQGFVFIVFLGLVAITVIIYQGVVQSGTNTGVVSGIALSLIPSGIIAVLGLAVKSKLHGDKEKDKENEHESLFTRATTILRKRISKKAATNNDADEPLKDLSHSKDTIVSKNGTENALTLNGLEAATSAKDSGFSKGETDLSGDIHETEASYKNHSDPLERSVSDGACDRSDSDFKKSSAAGESNDQMFIPERAEEVLTIEFSELDNKTDM